MKLILKPTKEELEAAEKTGDSYYFVKRFNLWSYKYYPANKTGLVIQMTLMGLVLFLFVYVQQRTSITYFFLSILVIINVAWMFFRHKSYPTDKRISRYSNLHEVDKNSVHNVHKTVDEIYNSSVTNNLKIENSEPFPKATYSRKIVITFLVVVTTFMMILFVILIFSNFNKNQLTESQVNELLKSE